MKRDVIIIGAGPAGMTAAIYAARAGAKPLVIEKSFAGGQMTSTADIENYPGFESINGIDLSMQMEKQAKNFGAEVISAQVQSVEFKSDIKNVCTDKGDFTAGAVIIAMGARRRSIGCEGEEKFIGAGVSYCASCDGNFFRGRDVCVVGGGNTALEDAIYLANICGKVYLIHRRDTFRGTKTLIDRVKEKSNIEILYDTVVESINGKDSVEFIAVKNVKTGEKNDIPLSGVFAAVGTIPETELFSGQLEIDEKGYLISGEDTKTKIPGVFAAGDIRKKPLYQIATAVSDGAVAGNAAAEYISNLGE